MSYNARRILPPSASRKRKEREPTVGPTTSWKPLSTTLTAVNPPVSLRAAATTSLKPNQPKQPISSNRLLAGYMAYEYLTKGTLFGEKFDPARAEAVPVGNNNNNKNPTREGQPKKPNGYDEVANLLKTDGAQLPGVVNPTQLARWIRDVKEGFGSPKV